MKVEIRFSNDEILDAVREYASKRGHALTSIVTVDDCDSDEENSSFEAVGEYEVEGDELLPVPDIEEADEDDEDGE